MSSGLVRLHCLLGRPAELRHCPKILALGKGKKTIHASSLFKLGVENFQCSMGTLRERTKLFVVLP